MNRDTIIRMAREAGIFTGGHPMNSWSVYPSDLERFAALVENHLKSQGYRQCAKGQSTTQYCGMVEQAVKAEREACAELVWPTQQVKVWSEDELTAITGAFNRAQEKHGWYETLMAVAATALKGRAAAIRSRA